jgi:hypothetical protein
MGRNYTNEYVSLLGTVEAGIFGGLKLKARITDTQRLIPNSLRPKFKLKSQSQTNNLNVYIKA